MLRHVPNLLSAVRLLAAPFAAWLILAGRDSAALAVFAFAGLSDALDGAIARRWGFISRFGEWLDPVADKLLMLLCFIALYGTGAAPLWLMLLVIGRDLAIAAAWLLAKALAWPLRDAPLRIGKASTLVQVLYLFLTLLLQAFDLVQPRLTEAAAWLCGIFTLLSGAAYAARFVRGFARRAA